MKNFQNIAIAFLAFGLAWALHVNDQQGKSLSKLFSEDQHLEWHIVDHSERLYEIESNLEDPFIIRGEIVENLQAGGCLTDEHLWEVQQSNLTDEQKNWFFEMDMKNSANGCRITPQE